MTRCSIRHSGTMFPVCAGIETNTLQGLFLLYRCFPCVRELKHRPRKRATVTVMFPVCAGIEKPATFCCNVRRMFPVCAGIETDRASTKEARDRCFPCVRELKQGRTVQSPREVMFPVCAGIETVHQLEQMKALVCFPCVRELKPEPAGSYHQGLMFPVCAGIETPTSPVASAATDVSRVCGN